jgi:hypothetical protein
MFVGQFVTSGIDCKQRVQKREGEAGNRKQVMPTSAHQVSMTLAKVSS